MAMEVKIHKKLGEYELDVHWKSTKKRIGILGASGSGKSLTLKSIAGIEHPDQGHIQIGDHVLYDSDSRICLKPQKCRIYVPELCIVPNDDRGAECRSRTCR